MTALDNLKTATAAVWNAIPATDLPSMKAAMQNVGPKRTSILTNFYRQFYQAFSTPANMPPNPRHNLDFDAINTVLGQLGSCQNQFVQGNGTTVTIQDNVFREITYQNRANYPQLFWSLPGEQLYRCFYHFNFPRLQAQRDAIRLAINVPLERIPAAINGFLLGARNTDPDVMSFKVGGPGLYRKPDTALIYILRPSNQTEQGYLNSLVQAVTTWEGSDPQNALRDWTHPLMERLAAGVATADDPPRVAQYDGMSFTALRAVVATIVFGNLIRLYNGPSNIQGTTEGELAAAALVGQLENYGIDAQNPSRNAPLPDTTTLDRVRDYGLLVRAIVT